MGQRQFLALCLLFGGILLGCPPCLAAGGRLQESLAKSLRTKALAYRTQADQAHKEAAQDRADADSLSGKAKELRAQASGTRSKGDASGADALDQRAKQAENEAATDREAADNQDQKAAKFEELAAEKEADARKLEAQSKSAADQVYRKFRQSLATAQADLADLKQHQTTTRVGRQSMSVRWLTSHIHDEELKPFGQGELNALFKPYEGSFSRMASQAEQDRDNLAAGRQDADAYCGSVYDLFHTLAVTIEDAEFSLVAQGYDTYEADIYKVERRLNAEWAAQQEALRNSNETEQQKQADRDALYQKQSGERRTVFYDVAKRYRVEKNRLALFRMDWTDEITGWHDFAAKLSHGDDAHRRATTDLENLIRGYFTKDGTNLPLSLGIFAFSPDSKDRFITPYGEEYPWLKARPFPDIVDADSPGLLRMHAIADKLPLLVKGGKYDGAAKTIGP